MNARSARRLIAGLALTLASSVTLAQAEGLDRLIDLTCIDLIEEEIGCERVILMRNADDTATADLIILPHLFNDDASKLLVVPSAVWSGQMFGDLPTLSRLENGSLQITTMQTGAGSNPWEHALTVAMRDGVLQVVGETFSTYDRLELSNFSCDVNLLTGRYEAQGSPSQLDRATGEQTDNDEVFAQDGQIAPAAYPLAQLHYAKRLPAICDSIRDNWPLD